MAKYVCRPRVVEASQFDPSQPESEWPGEVFYVHGRPVLHTPGGRRMSQVMPGDWIVTNEDGDARVITDRVFQTLYEPVPVARVDDDLREELARSIARAAAADRAAADVDLDAEPSQTTAFDNSAVDLDRTRDELPPARRRPRR